MYACELHKLTKTLIISSIIGEQVACMSNGHLVASRVGTRGASCACLDTLICPAEMAWQSCCSTHTWSTEEVGTGIGLPCTVLNIDMSKCQLSFTQPGQELLHHIVKRLDLIKGGFLLLQGI